MNIKEVISVKKLDVFLEEGGNINEIILGEKYEPHENLMLYLLRINRASKMLVNKLIKNGININFENSENENALFYTKDIQIAKLLIENGIDVNCLNSKRRNVLMEIDITSELCSLYLSKDINIWQVDKYGSDIFSRLNGMDRDQSNEKLFLILDEYHDSLPPSLTVSLLKEIKKTIDEASFMLTKEDLLKYGSLEINGSEKIPDNIFNALKIKNILLERNYNFALSEEQFTQEYSLIKKINKVLNKNDSSELMNCFLYNIFADIERRSDPEANNFKESFMDKHNKEFRAEMQKNILMEAFDNDVVLKRKKLRI